MPKLKKRKTIGLALGSGGWRGLAHIGVIKTLVQNDIPIDYIAGSSTGALIGGLYAALQDPDQLEAIFNQLNYRKLLYAFLDPRPRGGLFKGKRAIKMLDAYIQHKKIEDLNIPFTALATDFISGELVRINQGDLATAIRASASVPFIFHPVPYKNYQLVDGATITPVPVKTCRDMGADIVIAVNLYKNLFPIKKQPKNAVGVALRTTQLMLKQLAKQDCKQADLCILPDIEESVHYRIFTKFVRNHPTIEVGEQAAQAQIKNIKKLLT